MRDFFNRENAFRMMLFSSIFIMALYQFLFNGEYVAQITSFLGLLTFLLSLLNMTVLVLEKIINNYDEGIENIFLNIGFNDVDNYYKMSYDISRCKKSDLCDKLSRYCDCQNNKEFYRGFVVKYWFLSHNRKNIRSIRRFFLYLYFATITTILVFLFLSHEILPYIKNFNFGDWTIFSLVIILFEILIKDEISEGIYSFINGVLVKKCDKFINKIEENTKDLS